MFFWNLQSKFLREAGRKEGVAEQVHKAQIKTNCNVQKIIPLNALGDEDISVDGAEGYRVYYYQLDVGDTYVDTHRVVVSAGTLGTDELLLRCRDIYRRLPRISERLGHTFSYMASVNA